MTDPEISGLLKHLQHTPNAEQAFRALQQYRAEALGELPAGVTRRQVADQAHEQLRGRLLHLLVNGQTVGPAVDYVVGRTQVLTQRGEQEQEVRVQAGRVWHEMVMREEGVMLDGGLPLAIARIAAANNLALRRVALEDELITELARIHGEARRRIEDLLEDLQDT